MVERNIFQNNFRLFCLLQTKMLPTQKLKKLYSNEWIPIMKMECVPGIVIPNVVHV